jgi:hypothetical protein
MRSGDEQKRKTLVSMAATALCCILFSQPGHACLAPMLESVKENRASVVFEGSLLSYKYDPTSKHELALVKYKVLKTIRGESRSEWAAVMRGRLLPPDRVSFKQKFGDGPHQVGLYFFDDDRYQMTLPKSYRALPFVVNAVCNIHGDWFIKGIVAR